MGNATQAKITYTTTDNNGTVRMYESVSGNTHSTATPNYIWTQDGTCNRYVGYFDYGTITDMKNAGTLTSDGKLVLAYNGQEFTVETATFKIVQKAAG